MAQVRAAGPDGLPLTDDGNGGLRVGNSRVRLESVVRAHQGGATPEEIVRAYDTLELADVYAVIAYYQRHESEVIAYLRRREAQADTLEQDIRAAQPAEVNLRAKLEARRNRMMVQDAPPRD